MAIAPMRDEGPCSLDTCGRIAFPRASTLRASATPLRATDASRCWTVSAMYPTGIVLVTGNALSVVFPLVWSSRRATLAVSACCCRLRGSPGLVITKRRRLVAPSVAHRTACYKHAVHHPRRRTAGGTVYAPSTRRGNHTHTPASLYTVFALSCGGTIPHPLCFAVVVSSIRAAVYGHDTWRRWLSRAPCAVCLRYVAH